MTDQTVEQTVTVSETPVGHSGANVDVAERPAWTLNTGPSALVLILCLCAMVGIVFALLPLLASGGAATAVGVVVLTIFEMVCVFILACLRINSPGQTSVVQLFGKYMGTSRHTGLFMVAPLTNTQKVSVRVRNFETNAIKVNDLNGNPVVIGAIVVWQVADTAKASFAVEDMEQFIHAQSESALRHVATTHPYDSTDLNTVPSLSGSTDIVSQELADELAARVSIAGLEIVEARISALSYAPEIAQSMLQRQQANAVVDARETIVEGAVSMVETALDKLEQRDIVDLDPERRAAMVSNLLVVLCSDTSTQPVVNTGSLYT